MAAITSQDDIVKAIFSGKLQRIHFEKTTSTSGANFGVSLWTANGQPTSGSYGASGNANGRVCNQSTSGSLQFVTSSAGKNLYLASTIMTSITALNSLGHFAMFDRISDCLIPHSASSGSISGLDATSRLGSTSGPGDGAQIFIESQTALSTALNTFQIEYTNQNGVSGRLTPIFPLGGGTRTINQIFTSQFFAPLQTGDTGVRSIQGITRISGSQTGNIAIALVRPLVEITTAVAANPSWRDFIQDIRFLPPISNDACLMFAFASPASAAHVITGDIFLIEL